MFWCPDTIIRRMFGETHNVCMIFPFANFFSPFLLKQSFSILLFLEKTYFSPCFVVHLPFKTPVLFLSPSRAYATKVWVNQCRQYSVTNGLKMAAHTISTDVLLPWHTLYSCKNNLSWTSGQQLIIWSWFHLKLPNSKSVFLIKFKIDIRIPHKLLWCPSYHIGLACFCKD